MIVVTALSANLVVIIPRSFTINGLVVVPAPSIVVMSATAPKAVPSIQATTPELSVTNTLLFPPDAIFVVVIAASASFVVVTFKSLIFVDSTALFAKSSTIIVPSNILAVVTASLEIVVATVPVPVPLTSPVKVVVDAPPPEPEFRAYKANGTLVNG